MVTDILKKCWIQGMTPEFEYTGKYDSFEFPLESIDQLVDTISKLPVVKDDLDCFPCIGLDGFFLIRRIGEKLFFCDIRKKYGDLSFIRKMINDTFGKKE